MRRWITGVTLALVVANAATAQEKFTGGPAAGKTELALQGSLMFSSNSGPNGTLDPSFGYFITRQLEVGAKLHLDWASRLWCQVDAGPTVRYHFLQAKPSRLVPFVGGELLLGYDYHNGAPPAISEFNAGGAATTGLRYFVSNSASLEAGLRLHYTAGRQMVQSGLDVLLGVGALF